MSTYAPTHQWTSFDDAFQHTTTIQPNDTWFTREAVAQRMLDHQCGVWHACHSLVVDAIASGEAGYGTCQYCGGPTAPNQNNMHQLCKARHDCGRDTPRLDSTPLCYCQPCAKERGGN